MYLKIFSAILLFILVVSCEKNEDPPPNPYDEFEYDTTYVPDTTQYEIDSTAISGLHQLIFEPVCANSGCHDGTFEPDFRYIESSYHSLVNRTAISPNVEDNLTKRVVPFEVDSSMLIYRMENFLINSSGIMPLAIDNEGYWESNKEQFIENIKTWINDGAQNL